MPCLFPERLDLNEGLARRHVLPSLHHHPYAMGGNCAVASHYRPSLWVLSHGWLSPVKRRAFVSIRQFLGLMRGVFLRIMAGITPLLLVIFVAIFLL